MVQESILADGFQAEKWVACLIIWVWRLLGGFGWEQCAAPVGFCFDILARRKMLPHDPLWGPYHISLQSQVAVPSISFYQPGEIQLWIAPLARLPHTSSDGKSGTTRPILSKDTVQWYSQGWQISSSATLHQGTVCQWRSEQLPLPTWQKVDHQHSFWNLGGKFVAFFMCETPNGFVTQLGGSSK